MNGKTAALLIFLMLLGSFAALALPAQAQTYTYTLMGSYWDDGSTANIDIGISVQGYDGDVWRGQFIGGSINTTVLSSSTPITQILWSKVINGSVSDQRFIDVAASDNGGTFKLKITSGLFAAYSYPVSISSFTTVTTAYLQTLTMVSGSNEVVEQRSLDFTGEVYFWLAQWGSYTFRVVCDQGSHSELFMAQDPAVVYKIILTAGNFEAPNGAATESIGASRPNSTEIIYWGTTNETFSDYSVEVYHYDAYSVGHEEISDYTDNGSAVSSFGGTLDGFDASTTYYVRMEITKADGLTYLYTFPLSVSGSSEAFEGLSEGLSNMGDLGIDPTALLAFLICVIVGACFSYANFELGAAAVLVCAVILGVLGFYVFSAANLALGGFIVFLAYAHKAKMTERDM